MPTSLCPPNTPHASFSRRSFFALAATAASYAALGPVAFESAPLDHASQHPLSRQAWAAGTRSPHNTIEGILGATRCALDELKAHEFVLFRTPLWQHRARRRWRRHFHLGLLAPQRQTEIKWAGLHELHGIHRRSA